MTLFNRMADIINSNVNAMLDQAEDPEKIIRMIITEMQSSLVQLRASAAAQIADNKNLTGRLTHLQTESTHWLERTELAINRGRDDLAKVALQQKIHFESLITQTEADLAQLAYGKTQLKQHIKGLEEKLKSARARQQALILRGQTAKSRIKIKHQIDRVTASGAFSKFDDYERRLDLLEGEVESYSLGNTSLSTELDCLQADESLNNELEDLKARMKITPSMLISGSAKTSHHA